MHGKTYSRFVIREREGGRSLVTWPATTWNDGEERVARTTNVIETVSPYFQSRSNIENFSAEKAAPFRRNSTICRAYREREREQSPLARIVATFRQWEPRIPRLKRSLVSSSSYNVAFSTTFRRTANNSLGCFQPSPSSTGLKRTPWLLIGETPAHRRSNGASNFLHPFPARATPFNPFALVVVGEGRRGRARVSTVASLDDATSRRLALI